ncbi:hypothetical protein MYCTH_2134282 [Thermothelomyces thermophilus ATCC 42464]|uniref:Uncharacterized protein n=1 Tax=Thermothelomyces thermophilus (strain ATCC 42464 / BCRC 31852 / DSM 1799) TaxID=573729 RepID=G2QBX6_THET4|nr:uncharacterized protein MYCTH_2134282 [Thermothelomyces thermophilus ATCC 42464]AEO58058.1 hypothetical protein MYCTH_2134282 [Thermothelomyces thermophilus ATCC 42464]
MSTAIAMAVSPAPHDRPSSYGSDLPPPTSTSPSAQRTGAAPPPPPPASAAAANNASAPPTRSSSGSPKGSTASAAAGAATPGAATTQRSSPPSASRNASGPKIVVKKEPSSPGLQAARHRPRKLDLSKNTSIVSPATGRPMTARDGLAIQEVGLACLSPGFVPKDAAEQEQLNRSMTVREHQRQIIEARLQQQSAKMGDNSDKDKESSHFAAKTPGLARKRGPPPGLSIVAPSHEQFANERVIQSAPLGQTFTGRHNPHPLTRHVTNQPSNLASMSHIHHVPANQTNNRLPPIADVFGQNLSGHPESSGHALFAGQNRAPLPSPHHPPAQPQPARTREYKSAEEAQVELAGGRPELLPKLVRYGGHQPPTPPSPPNTQASRDYPHSQHNVNTAHNAPSNHHHHNHQSHHRLSPNLADPSLPTTSSRTLSNNHQAPPPGSGPSGSGTNPMKRRRAEYEEGGSPPLGNGGRPAPAAPHPPQPQQQQQQSMPLPFGAASAPRRAFFGEGRDSPETLEAKKEEFLSLCARAWDLLHS